MNKKAQVDVLAISRRTSLFSLFFCFADDRWSVSRKAEKILSPTNKKNEFQMTSTSSSSTATTTTTISSPVSTPKTRAKKQSTTSSPHAKRQKQAATATAAGSTSGQTPTRAILQGTAGLDAFKSTKPTRIQTIEKKAGASHPITITIEDESDEDEADEVDRGGGGGGGRLTLRARTGLANAPTNVADSDAAAIRGATSYERIADPSLSSLCIRITAMPHTSWIEDVGTRRAVHGTDVCAAGMDARDVRDGAAWRNPSLSPRQRALATSLHAACTGPALTSSWQRVVLSLLSCLDLDAFPFEVLSRPLKSFPSVLDPGMPSSARPDVPVFVVPDLVLAVHRDLASAATDPAIAAAPVLAFVREESAESAKQAIAKSMLACAWDRFVRFSDHDPIMWGCSAQSTSLRFFKASFSALYLDLLSKQPKRMPELYSVDLLEFPPFDALNIDHRRILVELLDHIRSISLPESY